MPNAKHALRPALVLFGALVLAACSGGNHNEDTAEERSSSAGLPSGRVAVGEQLASAKGKATGQSCVDCHGADGNVPIDDSYPKLGGQYADYLAHALQAYRAGDRQHALMTPQAASLTDQEIADVSAYFGSRPSQLRDLHNAY